MAFWAAGRDWPIVQPRPHQLEQVVGGAWRYGTVPQEEAKPQGAIEDIEGVVNVQVGSQLAGDNAFLQGCRPPGSAVGEEPVSEVLGQRSVALGVGDQLPDQLAAPRSEHGGDPPSPATLRL